MILQLLVITFKPEEIVLHALYRTQDSLALTPMLVAGACPRPSLLPARYKVGEETWT
jgi:hypothetical protein